MKRIKLKWKKEKIRQRKAQKHMEFNFRTITTSFVIILATSANAQTRTYKVSGTVKDNNGKAVELATVNLNNDLVTSTVAGGRFVLNNVPKLSLIHI